MESDSLHKNHVELMNEEKMTKLINKYYDKILQINYLK